MSFINIFVFKIIKYCLVTILFFITIIISPPFIKQVYASYSPPIFLENSSQASNYLACPDIECSDNPGVCANSQNLNNCGLPTCGGGDAWTKYNKVGCGKLPNQLCNTLYSPGDKVYSIGDKCISGGPYLNIGYCESAFGGPIYKTCCSGDGNALSPFQCVAFDSDHAGDPEGRCPAGYQREVMCGGAGEPECGQGACGPVGSPKTCDFNRSYNQCCGNNLSQNVDEYTWSDGTGVCNHVVGECNQTDPTCAGATPPPAATPTPTPSPAPPTDTQAPTCTSFTLNGQCPRL